MGVRRAAGWLLAAPAWGPVLEPVEPVEAAPAAGTALAQGAAAAPDAALAQMAAPGSARGPGIPYATTRSRQGAGCKPWQPAGAREFGTSWAWGTTPGDAAGGRAEISRYVTLILARAQDWPWRPGTACPATTNRWGLAATITASAQDIRGDHPRCVRAHAATEKAFRFRGWERDTDGRLRVRRRDRRAYQTTRACDSSGRSGRQGLYLGDEVLK